MENSLITGKIQGISSISALERTPEPRANKGLAAKFPDRKAGNFMGTAGNFFREAGNLSAVTPAITSHSRASARDLLLHHVTGGIIARMGRGRISQTEADLFSTESPRGAPSPAANPPRNAALTTDIVTAPSAPRYLLPKDLSAGIRQLTDQELDR
jgi:hypothetical protein